MKSTGITRRIDDLGRVVLPVELRKNLDLQCHDSMEILLSEGRDVVLRKVQLRCTLCDNDEDLINFKGKVICSTCLFEMGVTAR